MPDIKEYSENLRAQVLKLVGQTQENTVDLVKTVTQAVNERVPEAVTEPLAERIPQVGEIVNAAFGFATALLSAQQSFVSQLIEAATPEKKQAPVRSAQVAA